MRNRITLKQTREMMLQRRTVVSELLLQGKRRNQILEIVKAQMGLETYSRSTLKADVDACISELNELRPDNVEKWRTLQVERYLFVYDKALTKYEKTGDEKFLVVALKTLERIDKILGLEKVNVNVAGDFKADITIDHVMSGHAPASSEAEIRKLEGMKEV